VLPKCVKLLDHYMGDEHDNPYLVDATHKPPDPGFNTGADPVNFELALQTAIQKSPRPELATLLHRTVKPGKPAIPDVQSFSDLDNSPYKLSIGIADMTGDPTDPNSKFNKPMYAAHFDRESIYPASLAKLTVIYALHQLKYDAAQKATTAPASMQGNKAKLTQWVFDSLHADWTAKGLKRSRQPVMQDLLVADAAGKTMVFTPLCIANMRHITHPDNFDVAGINEMNNAMTALITSVHASYMGSVFLQSGHCKEDQGGMWVYSAWGEKWNCDGGVPQLYPKQPGTEVMAWSAARCVALLGQERLVSPSISKELKTVLADGDTGWGKGGLKKVLPASELATLNTWGKEGAWGGFASDALYIERTNSAGKTYRYAVACLLSSTAPASSYPVAQAETDPVSRATWDVLLKAIVESIIPALDGVIVGNNP
jgi:hypothetical protein